MTMTFNVYSPFLYSLNDKWVVITSCTRGGSIKLMRTLSFRMLLSWRDALTWFRQGRHDVDRRSCYCVFKEVAPDGAGRRVQSKFDLTTYFAGNTSTNSNKAHHSAVDIARQSTPPGLRKQDLQTAGPVIIASQSKHNTFIPGAVPDE